MNVSLQNIDKVSALLTVKLDRISTSILWKSSNSFSILLWHLNSKLK